MNAVTRLAPVGSAPIADRLFRSLAGNSDRTVSPAQLGAVLADCGLQRGDPRLARTFANLDSRGPSASLGAQDFAKLLPAEELALVERALAGQLVLPDFGDFRLRLEAIFDSCQQDTSGEVASYIPQLARVPADKFAMGVCSTDGQRFSRGDDSDRFCVQSTCKPMLYALAHGLHGSAGVHRHVGREPSGRSFNELTLNPAGLPHNPMINAGAIMCASLIKPEEPLADRFDFMVGKWWDMSGGVAPGFDNAVFLSEKATADRNFALAYFMRENGAFPADTDLMATLDFYFQCCSLSMDVRQMAVVAATLANSGICPLTNERVLGTDTVRDCLSLMYSCGMYDFSGEFAFTVGIPAKSGVSGALLLAVPGGCGSALWSPRLDRCGNSVRGGRFAADLARSFAFHSYAGLVGDAQLANPVRRATALQEDISGHACAAAATGDIGELRRFVALGADVSRPDYDGRTPMHLAASEGCESALEFLLSSGCEPMPRDRWGNTPLDDARREGREGIIALLSELPKGSNPPKEVARNKRR